MCPSASLRRSSAPRSYIYSHNAWPCKGYENRVQERSARCHCYALKANSNAAFVKLIGELGGGADVVSGGELYSAMRQGFRQKDRLCGRRQKEDEFRLALTPKILHVNVVSVQELIEIDRVAA